jgi:hypothetical protein
MENNAYKTTLLVLGILAFAIGGITWMTGSAQAADADYFSDGTEGLASIAAGGVLMNLGLILIVVWLAVSALVVGLATTTSESSSGVQDRQDNA